VTTQVHLRETGPAQTVPLSGDQARRIVSAKVVDIRPGPTAGTWALRADRIVGATRIGDVEIYIAPKVAPARLLFMLGYARDPSGWRDRVLPMDKSADLVPAMADALSRLIDSGLRGGLLHGYRPTETTSTVLRGRLREPAQLARRPGQPLPLEIRYDEFTPDIPENRILATATDRMLRTPGVVAATRRRLSHLSRTFAGVERVRAGAEPPNWHPSRLNTRIQPAVRLAELVLAGSSLDASPGRLTAHGFLLNMATVFESFLAVALRRSIQRRHGGVVLAKHPHHLDHGGRVRLEPDLAWRHGGRIRAVADAKYKLSVPAADVYQMLAYCTGFGLTHGHLVYTRDEPDTTDHVVRNTGIRILCHSINLDQPSIPLLAEIDLLADQIVQPGAASLEASG